jgi:hypothetical protein
VSKAKFFNLLRGAMQASLSHKVVKAVRIFSFVEHDFDNTYRFKEIKKCDLTYVNCFKI